jgi:hypothetical protein
VKGTTKQNEADSHTAAARNTGWNWKWFAPPGADAGTVFWMARPATPKRKFTGAIPPTQATRGPGFGREGFSSRSTGLAMRLDDG